MCTVNAPKYILILTPPKPHWTTEQQVLFLLLVQKRSFFVASSQKCYNKYKHLKSTPIIYYLY